MSHCHSRFNIKKMNHCHSWCKSKRMGRCHSRCKSKRMGHSHSWCKSKRMGHSHSWCKSNKMGHCHAWCKRWVMQHDITSFFISWWAVWSTFSYSFRSVNDDHILAILCKSILSGVQDTAEYTLRCTGYCRVYSPVYTRTGYRRVWVFDLHLALRLWRKVN